MQYKVPQNVQREDTIIGPLTIKQTIIAVCGGGISWLLWKLIEAPLSYPFVLGVVAITIAVVFIKIQGLTFLQYLGALILLLLRPRSRSWQKGSGEIWLSGKDMEELARIRSERAKKQRAKLEKDTSKLGQLDELAKILDTRGKVEKSLKGK
ncbi:MAG: PrgI family protein [Candidatus Gracilibacteria bacterium]|nr:PrgI family protein [Candidatus Gracilibacteria bacterium]